MYAAVRHDPRRRSSPGIAQSGGLPQTQYLVSILNGYELEIVAEDEQWKRVHMQRVLDNTEYLIIGTNRRYDFRIASRCAGR